ncbi:MAG: di-heme oxidoredictase family protein [Longimicrobiales bacterium]
MYRPLAFAPALLALLASACWGEGGEAPFGEPGTPLPGLSDAELARFERGRAWFDHAWSPEQGLGPLYLQERCSSCHDLPALGGTGVETRLRMTHYDPVAGCDPLTEEGGPVRQERSTPLAQALGILREEVAPSATERIREVPPLLYGLGLIEAIPEEVIESLADPLDADGDGISGRVNRLPDGRTGRLTRKAEVATILEFAEKAFLSDLGLTSARLPAEETLNGVPLPPETDPVPDPELDPEILSAVADFVRFLAAPIPEEPRNPATRDSLVTGSRLFRETGCASCHVPTLKTGAHEVAALSEKTVPLYSDLLLHDMGPDYRGVCAGGVSPTEFRTGRLMGLRLREPYSLGSVTPGLEKTIRAHGGEARGAREAFEKLGPEGQRLILRFIRSL